MEARWRLAQTQAGDGGALEPFGIPGEMTEAINPPLADMVGAWASRLGRVVAEDALAAAESLDALIEEIAPGIADAIIRDKPNFVDRSIHRGAHVDQLERALAAVRAPRPPADRSYLARNDSSRAQLRETIGALTADQLALTTEEGGWTIGQVLGHVAFWDRFLTTRWRAAVAAGPAMQPGTLPHELSDLLNATLPPSWAALAVDSPELAVSEMLAAADEVDAVIAGLPAETPVLEVLATRTSLLDRSIHRKEHLDQIRRAIG
jgi:hypothetical protein